MTLDHTVWDSPQTLHSCQRAHPRTDMAFRKDHKNASIVGEENVYQRCNGCVYVSSMPVCNVYVGLRTEARGHGAGLRKLRGCMAARQIGFRRARVFEQAWVNLIAYVVGPSCIFMGPIWFQNFQSIQIESTQNKLS